MISLSRNHKIHSLMKKIIFRDLPYLPASHEDSQNPCVLKKILFQKKDLHYGRKIQMINWAVLAKGKSFTAHYHEGMDEIFIIISGKAIIQIGGETDILEKGDCVLIPMKKVHVLKNIGNSQVTYIVIGITLGKGGKTRIV